MHICPVSVLRRLSGNDLKIENRRLKHIEDVNRLVMRDKALREQTRVRVWLPDRNLLFSARRQDMTF